LGLVVEGTLAMDADSATQRGVGGGCLVDLKGKPDIGPLLWSY